jgi:hypothetical protein
VEWKSISPVYDPRRKRCHFFSELDGAEKGPDGKPVRALHLMSYDPVSGTLEASPPVKSPQGSSPELTLDVKRDRLVCLLPSGPDKDAAMELWTYDFGTNSFAQLQAGGDPPRRQSGAPRTIAWDPRGDLYVVWRGRALHVLRPADGKPATSANRQPPAER